MNDPSIARPELAPEWHTTKNGELTPDKVVDGSGGNVSDTRVTSGRRRSRIERGSVVGGVTRL